jgi:hypothetical protein
LGLLAQIENNHRTEEKIMLKDTDKTIPYRLSPAELENFRLLRRRMKLSSFTLPDDGEEPEETESLNADLDRPNAKVEKKLP